MCQLKTAYIVFFVIIYCLKAEAADKYTDKNRPYEFGFTIDGEQHRHEKKDENGIIMGEFGFITADGVYHVTVYATDENGKFKILSMKNIRVKPYPTAPGISERKGHSLELPQSQQQLISQAPAKAQQSQQQKQPLQVKKAPVNACSSCSIPTTTTVSPKQSGQAIIPPIDQSVNNNKQSQIPEKQSYNNLGRNNQQVSVPSQTLQQPLHSDYNHPNQQSNTNNQQQYSQQTSSQQNTLQINTQTSDQQDFNVGRQYLQRSRLEQNYQSKSSLAPNSVQETYPQQGQNQVTSVSANGHNYGRDYTNQNNLQEPTVKQNNQESSYPAQSYSKTAGAYGDEQMNNDKRTNYPINDNVQQSYAQDINSPQNYPKSNTNNYVPQDQNRNSKIQDNTLQQQQPLQPDRQPKTFKDLLHSITPEEYKPTNTGPNSPGSLQPNTGNSEKPALIAAQMQIVDKNTDIHHKNPGETEGLPKGLTKGDMQQLLYTFNYTLGFQAHHEEGYTNGAKVGYYYVTGRNGIRMRVDYVADDTGFHPRISQEVLDIQSEDVPKPETEKDEKYGLKGYEFKWLYYPVDSK